MFSRKRLALICLFAAIGVLVAFVLYAISIPSVNVMMDVYNNLDRPVERVILRDRDGRNFHAEYPVILSGDTARFEISQDFDPYDNLLVLYIGSEQVRGELVYLSNGSLRASRILVELSESASGDPIQMTTLIEKSIFGEDSGAESKACVFVWDGVFE